VHDEHSYEEDDVYEERERAVRHWRANGASMAEAEQLWEDFWSDPSRSDPDQERFDDPTIDDRLKKFGGLPPRDE
jgi:hypothetical protein